MSMLRGLMTENGSMLKMEVNRHMVGEHARKLQEAPRVMHATVLNRVVRKGKVATSLFQEISDLQRHQFAI